MRWPRLESKALAYGFSIGMALGLSCPTAQAEEGRRLQVGPDRVATMVQIDAGSERWSIVFDEERGIVLGNVFPKDGGEPSFVFCRVTGETRSLDSEFLLDCQGSGSCRDEACPGVRPDGRRDWQNLGTVRIAAALLRPPEGKSPAGQQTRFCGDMPVSSECSWELDEEACRAAGGCWEFGPFERRCACPTTDAGRPCDPNNASDCQGFCEGIVPSGDLLQCRFVTSGVCSESTFSGCACTASSMGFWGLCE